MLEILFMIIDAITGVMAVVLLLRFWMQAIRIRPPLQVSQFTYQLSDWLVKPLRRLVPGVGGYDWASLIGALLVALVVTLLKLAFSGSFSAMTIGILSLARLAQWILYGWTGLLIISVIFSWLNPSAPLAPFINALSDPILRPIRRILPPFGNIDLSPMVALIVLQIALRMLEKMTAFLLGLSMIGLY